MKHLHVVLSYPYRIVHRFLAILAVACLAGWISSAAPAQATNPTPNIVFIISDDHAWTDYGFMGHPHIETPRLDQLSRQSALFTRGYVPTALCRPALATLATGLYAHQHGITGNDPTPPSSTRTPDASEVLTEKAMDYPTLRERLISNFDRHSSIAHRLAQAGYLSFQSGKWWEGGFGRGGFTHGMTRGFPLPGGRHGDDGLKIGREGMQPIFDFIELATTSNKPFFLWYAPFLPHDPHTPPERLFEKYKSKGITSDHVARYYAMVEWFDETCGQLLDHLEAKGLHKNTLVIYVGDNGWIQQSNAPGFAPRSKQSANEGGVRQPIMFRWLDVIEPANRGNQLCSSVDIVPTALAAAGVELPDSFPGFNLLPILKSGSPTPRGSLHGESFAHDVADIDDPESSLLYRWIIVDNWKLLLTYDGQLGRYAHHHPRDEKRPQLYDLLADPHEDTNLASQHPDVVARLAADINTWWPVTRRRVLTKWTDTPGRWE